MPDNSRVIQIFNTAAELTDNPIETKEKEFSWFSNGTKGFRHANKNCSELKVTSVLVEHELTVEQAGGKRICDKCFPYILTELSATGRVFANFFNNYLSLASEVSRFNLENINSYTLDVLFSSLENVKRIKTIADDFAKIDGFSEEHSKAITILEKLYSSFAEPVKSSLHSRKEEIFSEVGVLYLSKIIRSTGTFVVAGDSEAEVPVVNDTLGHSGIRQSNTLELYNAWTKVKMDPTKSEKDLEGIYSKFSLTDLKQLKHIVVNYSNLPQNTDPVNLMQYASECWSDFKDQLAVKTIAYWEARLQKITSDNKLVSLAVDTSLLSYLGSDLFPRLQLATTQVSVGESKMVLVLPMYVASHIREELPFRYGIAASPAQIHDEVLPLEIAETALNLWNARDEAGPYTVFSECVNSAAALCR